MGPDVVTGPQVEGEAHRLPVPLAEQRLDMGGEAHGLARARQRRRGRVRLVFGRGGAGGRPAGAPFPAGRRHRQPGVAGLPADPAFRSALSAYIQYASRATAPGQQPATAQQPEPAPPAWDWGPAGPPEPAPAAAPADQNGQRPTLPGPDETVTFTAHIKPLFRERDRQSMRFAFDLWSAQEVRAHAAGILLRLRDGSMPCDGAWPAGQVEVFQRWTDTGMRP